MDTSASSSDCDIIGSVPVETTSPPPAISQSAGKAEELTWPQWQERLRGFEGVLSRVGLSFPTEANRTEYLVAYGEVAPDKVVDMARGVRIILHSKVYDFMPHFIEHMKTHGTDIEKEVYRHINTPEELAVRLITKRPFCFFGSNDTHVLHTPLEGGYKQVAPGEFKRIGQEGCVLPMSQYISYSEMQLSALLGISNPNVWINAGDRNNAGEPGERGTFEKFGYYYASVGARFEVPGKMEDEHMLITSKCNRERGYGPDADKNHFSLLHLWASKLYDRPHFPSHEEAAESHDDAIYSRLFGSSYFNCAVYRLRMEYSLLPFLFDANSRGIAENKKVYCIVVGLGLGVWAKKGDTQGQIIAEVVADILHRYRDTLQNISDVNFSWFPPSAQMVEDSIRRTNVTPHFSRCNPAERLVGEDEGKLLASMYAWDGNSYPGNEYWVGMLTASGDPAAACCSTIPEIQNPLINPYLNSVKSVYHFPSHL